MSLIAFPSVLRTTQVSKGLGWPQSTLLGELTGTRQTLLLGYPFWRGVSRIETEGASDAKIVQAWLAQLQRSDNWTSLNLGVDAQLPTGTILTSESQAAATGVVRVRSNTDLLTALDAMPYITDGKRVRMILDATAVAGETTKYDLSLWPIADPIADITKLTEVTTIDAYLGDVNTQYLTRDIDFTEPISLPWQERVTP